MILVLLKPFIVQKLVVYLVYDLQAILCQSKSWEIVHVAFTRKDVKKYPVHFIDTELWGISPHLQLLMEFSLSETSDFSYE